MENVNLKHTQLPKRNGCESITPKDQLIYLSIRRDMDKDSKISKTSMQTLNKRTGASLPTIRNSIKLLAKQGYLDIIKVGRANAYVFNNLKSFEPFSDEFLDNEELSYLEKSVLIASQQYMFINDNEGITNYSNRELAEKINCSYQTVNNCINSLEKKNFVNVNKDNKIFYLNKFGQAIVSALKDHEDRIKDNTDRITALEKKIEKLTNTIEDKNTKLAEQSQEIQRLKNLNKTTVIL